MPSTVNLLFALLAVLEGLRLSAYQDQGGIWTIGFGHTKDVLPGSKCTADEARVWFEEDSAALIKLVDGNTDLLPVQRAAYASFGYNCGIGALLRVWEGRAELKSFIHAGGYVSDGLIRRRALEQALIESVK